MQKCTLKLEVLFVMLPLVILGGAEAYRFQRARPAERDILCCALLPSWDVAELTDWIKCLFFLLIFPSYSGLIRAQPDC